MSDRAGARTRHPSSRWQPNEARLAERVASRLRAAGHPWPSLAAAVMAQRGRLALPRDAFARRAGLSPALIQLVEEGYPADGGRKKKGLV